MIEKSALEYMLYHQKILAQVKSGSISRNWSHIFRPCTRRFDCFQNWCSARSRAYQPFPTIPCSRGPRGVVPEGVVRATIRQRELRAMQISDPGEAAKLEIPESLSEAMPEEVKAIVMQR